MGLRFRKSINVGPLRVNLSKSGVGYSVGKKGVRLTRTATGRTKATVSVPGTGLSYEKDLTSAGSKKSKSRSKSRENNESKGSNKAIWVLIFVVIIVGVLIWCKL